MVQEKEEEKIEVPAKFKDLVEKIEQLSVLDLAELVKILEKKFGVSATPVIGPGAQVVPAEPTPVVPTEEKSTWDVVLKEAGQSKIAVIKVMREITGKGLKEAKDLVDTAPQVVKTGAKKEEAEELKKKLEEAGATVELK